MGAIKQKATGAKKLASANETLQEDNSKHLIVFAFLAVSVFLAYSNSLNSPWALDDTTEIGRSSIENNLNLRLGHRKIAYLTFLFNKWINPSSVLNYRVVNIIIHIINSVLVYWISLVTLRLPAMRERFGRYSYPVALITATAFALHPINNNAVAYIVQRMTSLSALFVFLALLSYLYGRTSSSKPKAVSLYGAAAAFIFLGIFSKENAVMALPLILIYDYFFISGFTFKSLKRRIAVGLTAAIMVLAVSMPFMDAFKVFGVFLRMNQQITPYNWTAVDVYWTPLQHIMTEFRVVGKYIVLLLMPLPDFLVLDRWGLPISSGMTEPLSTLFSFLVISGLLTFSVLKVKKMPFVSFGLLWYFIAISLESFIAVGSDLYFEHRNYLPVAGLFLGITAQAAVLSKEAMLKVKTLWTVVLILAVLLGGLTFKRNFVWKDSVTLWSDTVRKAPENVRAMIALGNAYVKSADLASASIYYEKALKLSSLHKRAVYFHDSAYSLGMVSLFMGNLGQAKKVIDLMDSRFEKTYTTDILKGYYSALSGDTEAATRQFNQILPLATKLDRVVVYSLLGDTYRRNGNAALALENYGKAIELDPSFSEAYYGMGEAYFSLKDIKNAEVYISKTLSLDPANPLALSQMADILLVKKEPVEMAMSYAEKAVSSSPTVYQPYATMGSVLIAMGREEAAEEYFKKAHERGLRGYLLPYAKARAYFIKGDKDKAEAILREIANMDDAPDELRNIIKKDQGRLLSR
ncbi:MAG: Tetratricopeptide 1 repeat-containing protein [Nitrospirae bacterium]|nr:Tetratricopeptide 1 repeat-containing protein [Nitrospirota bacterium]